MSSTHFHANGNHRVKRRRRTALMTREQIYAAYQLYEAGWTTEQIAEKVWKQYGYAAPRYCARSLQQAFWSYRKPLRSKQDAAKVRYRNYRCKACGCRSHERTRGCKTCQTRHHCRKKAGLSYIELRPYREVPEVYKGPPRCSGCHSTDLDQQTAGCKPCSNRLGKRRARAEGRAKDTRRHRRKAPSQGLEPRSSA